MYIWCQFYLYLLLEIYSRIVMKSIFPTHLRWTLYIKPTPLGRVTCCSCSPCWSRFLNSRRLLSFLRIRHSGEASLTAYLFVLLFFGYYLLSFHYVIAEKRGWRKLTHLMIIRQSHNTYQKCLLSVPVTSLEAYWKKQYQHQPYKQTGKTE